jgi:hypothetical protein
MLVSIVLVTTQAEVLVRLSYKVAMPLILQDPYC